MKTLQTLLFACCITLFMASCGKDDDVTPSPTPNPDKEFELYIDFWNPDGNNPQISFDSVNSSPEIRIDFTQTFAGVAIPPNLTNVIIDNVRVIDADNLNYQIDSIIAYEWREDIQDWKIDVEFLMKRDLIEDLAVMLVLDASASLGTDLLTVKDYAKDFINRVFTQTPSAHIGIVDFSDQINLFGLTNDQAALEAYVDNIQQGPFTTLYEAMDLAITNMLNFQADGRSIMTFTDGTDNNSDPQFTPAYLYDRLTNDPSGIKLNSFMIGLDGNGGVDRPVLENLAANGGIAEFPGNLDQLGVVFTEFSQSIANVYNLTYIRNQQIIPQNDPAKLRFVVKASPK